MKTLRHLTAVGAVLLLTGCTDDPIEPPPDGGTNEPAWQVVLDGEDLDQALVSVWGTGAKDVFAVGGGLGNTPLGAIALHFDGTQWRKLAPGGDDSFWWVTGSGANDVWMVGENGRIEHYDGSGFQSHAYATSATLWGAWAFSPSDVWVVGGTPGGGTAEPNDLLLHYDGSAFAPVTLPEQLGVSFYKVWGSSADELYIVGEQGTIWHKVGANWTNESGVATSTLFTVFGCSAGEIYAVGGFDVLKSGGDGSWVEQDVSLNSGVNGVSCAAPGAAVIVGGGGLKQRLVDGAWIDEFTEPPYDDLHGSWAQGDGVFWAVGGDFLSSPTPNAPRDGIVARYGPGRIADSITP